MKYSVVVASIVCVEIQVVESSIWAKPAWTDSSDSAAKPVTAKEKRLPYTPWWSHFLVLPERRLIMCGVIEGGASIMGDLLCSLSRHHTLFAPVDKSREGAFENGCKLEKMRPLNQGIANEYNLRMLLDDDSWTKAVFFRDPLDRFLAAWLHACTDDDSDDGGGGGTRPLNNKNQGRGGGSGMKLKRWVRTDADREACRRVFGTTDTPFPSAVLALNSSWWRDRDLRPGSDEDRWRHQSSFCNGTLADPPLFPSSANAATSTHGHHRALSPYSFAHLLAPPPQQRLVRPPPQSLSSGMLRYTHRPQSHWRKLGDVPRDHELSGIRSEKMTIKRRGGRALLGGDSVVMDRKKGQRTSSGSSGGSSSSWGDYDKIMQERKHNNHQQNHSNSEQNKQYRQEDFGEDQKKTKQQQKQQGQLQRSTKHQIRFTTASAEKEATVQYLREKTSALLMEVGISLPDTEPGYRYHFPAPKGHPASSDSLAHLTSEDPAKSSTQASPSSSSHSAVVGSGRSRMASSLDLEPLDRLRFYTSPQLVFTVLRHYRQDYRAFQIPVPSWAAAMVGDDAVRSLGLTAPSSLPPFSSPSSSPQQHLQQQQQQQQQTHQKRQQTVYQTPQGTVASASAEMSEAKRKRQRREEEWLLLAKGRANEFEDDDRVITAAHRNHNQRLSNSKQWSSPVSSISSPYSSSSLVWAAPKENIPRDATTTHLSKEEGAVVDAKSKNLKEGEASMLAAKKKNDLLAMKKSSSSSSSQKRARGQSKTQLRPRSRHASQARADTFRCAVATTFGVEATKPMSSRCAALRAQHLANEDTSHYRL